MCVCSTPLLYTPTIPPPQHHYPLHTQINDRILFAAPGTTAPGLDRPAGAPEIHALRLVKALDMPSWWKTAHAVASEGGGGGGGGAAGLGVSGLLHRVGSMYEDGLPQATPEALINPTSEDPFAGVWGVVMGCCGARCCGGVWWGGCGGVSRWGVSWWGVSCKVVVCVKLQYSYAYPSTHIHHFHS